MQLVSEISNLSGVWRSTNVTDRRTDGRTTCDLNTGLCIKVNSSSFADNLQQNNNLTCHTDGNIVCRQPVCHYAAPLLGRIKTNATPVYNDSNAYSVLPLIAQDLLSTPASQASTERLFSVCDRPILTAVLTGVTE